MTKKTISPDATLQKIYTIQIKQGDLYYWYKSSMNRGLYSHFNRNCSELKFLDIDKANIIVNHLDRFYPGNTFEIVKKQDMKVNPVMPTLATNKTTAERPFVITVIYCRDNYYISSVPYIVKNGRTGALAEYLVKDLNEARRFSNAEACNKIDELVARYSTLLPIPKFSMSMAC